MHYENARSWPVLPAPALRLPGLRRLVRRTVDCPPGPPAPAVAADLSAIHSEDGPPRWMWLGHASFLMQLGGENVLIDPVFSTQIGQRFRRHVAPPLAPEQLPQIDTVLITQSRPDHLDPATIARLPRSATVLAPRGLGPWFCRRLFARIIELDWWDRVRVGPIEYTFVPAGNGAGASVLNVPRLHGGGFVIESEQASIYYAGDTARAAGFGQIGRRFPGLDVALLPVGGNRGSWLRPPSRLTPRQVCQAFVRTGARTLVPMHWGTFQLCSEALCAPVELLREHCRRVPLPNGCRLHVPTIGASVPLG